MQKRRRVQPQKDKIEGNYFLLTTFYFERILCKTVSQKFVSVTQNLPKGVSCRLCNNMKRIP